MTTYHPTAALLCLANWPNINPARFPSGGGAIAQCNYVFQPLNFFCLKGSRSFGTVIKYWVHVKDLQLHSNKQSHWSSSSTVCFLPRGTAVRVPGMHSCLQWNQALLLAKYRYIDNPNMIQTLASPSTGSLTRLLADNVKS
jgi:hypothetical protein